MGGGISQLTGRPDEKSEPKQVVVGSAPPNLNEITTEEKPADRDMADIPVPSPGAGGGGGWKTASPKPKEKSTRKIDPQDSDDEVRRVCNTFEERVCEVEDTCTCFDTQYLMECHTPMTSSRI
jgi:hypothetical protein